MLPIPDKAWVTGEFLQDWNDIVTGEAYVVLTLDDGIVFKIAENLIEKEHKLTLFSLNPVYEPFDVHVNEIKEVWRFVNYISAEIPEPVVMQDAREDSPSIAHDRCGFGTPRLPRSPDPSGASPCECAYPARGRRNTDLTRSGG